MWYLVLVFEHQLGECDSTESSESRHQHLIKSVFGFLSLSLTHTQVYKFLPITN